MLKTGCCSLVRSRETFSENEYMVSPEKRLCNACGPVPTDVRYSFDLRPFKVRPARRSKLKVRRRHRVTSDFRGPYLVTEPLVWYDRRGHLVASGSSDPQGQSVFMCPHDVKQ